MAGAGSAGLCSVYPAILSLALHHWCLHPEMWPRTTVASRWPLLGLTFPLVFHVTLMVLKIQMCLCQPPTRTRDRKAQIFHELAAVTLRDHGAGTHWLQVGEHSQELAG